MARIRLQIASAHPIVRTALGMLMKSVRDFEVLAEVDLSQLTKTHHEVAPDVFVVELTEAGLAGLRVIAGLLHMNPEAAVVVLTSNENPSYIRSMLATGVKGYVLRSASNSELYEAIRAASRGRRYLDPRLSDSLTDLVLGRAGALTPKPDVKRLSRREAQVLREVARGFTTKAIAERLGVSEKTIQTYRTRISEKLELHNRADLVHYAIAHGMLNSIESAS